MFHSAFKTRGFHLSQPKVPKSRHLLALAQWPGTFNESGIILVFPSYLSPAGHWRVAIASDIVPTFKANKKGRWVAPAVSFPVIGKNKSIPVTVNRFSIWSHWPELCHMATQWCKKTGKSKYPACSWTHCTPKQNWSYVSQEEWRNEILDRQIQCL